MTRARPLRSAAVLGAVVVVAVLGVRWGAEQAREAGLVGPPSVPVEYRALLREASARCPQVPVNVFAAQIEAESGWDSTAVSPAGAQGIAQFMPEVWKQYGIDASGDGRADVWDPVDAVHSAAALNCVNRKLVKQASGRRLDNTLAAYNAGYGAVLEHDGIPPYPETTDYVARIKQTSTSIEY